MIKAVVFDWGGVLIDDPAPGLMAYCAKYLNVSKEEYTKVHRKFEADFQKGTISEKIFWERVCSELGVPKPDTRSLWSEAFRSVYSEKKETFSIIHSLRKNGYKTGFLSNTEAPAMNYFYGKGYKIFHVTVFSCAEGTRKPERRIYEIAMERLGTKPKETIFVDDKKEYIDAAKNVGMKTILFKSPEQLKKELYHFSVKI